MRFDFVKLIMVLQVCYSPAAANNMLYCRRRQINYILIKNNIKMFYYFILKKHKQHTDNDYDFRGFF